MKKEVLFLRKIIINGPCEVSGEVDIQGAKNSILPILAATIIARNECVIKNCPNILDVHTSLEILNYLGCKTKFEGSTIIVDSSQISKNEIPEKLMRKMRSSIIFLGALIARTGRAKLTFPGGCELGPRPIDLHISALKQLGISIDNIHGNLECKIENKIIGTDIVLPFPSVGATENIILASSICSGTTTIENAAREPEIVDLTRFLNKIGAKIHGAGSSKIVIEGTHKFNSSEHYIIPDRIVAITLMAAAASTGGNLTLKNIKTDLISSAIPIFEESGCLIKTYEKNIEILSPETLYSVKEVRTMPYPGFPTDAQAIIMAMLSKAIGTSVFVETIFESRFKHTEELIKLGAKIKINGNVAIIEGNKYLSGAKLQAYDLRGAAALIIAGLAAYGKTTISGADYFLRGYDLSIFPNILTINE